MIKPEELHEEYIGRGRWRVYYYDKRSNEKKTFCTYVIELIC